MTADRLRQAAQKIRDTASYLPGPEWYADHTGVRTHLQGRLVGATPTPELAAHIALWSPPAALDAADTLDAIADVTEKFGMIPDAAIRWADRIIGDPT